MFSYNFLLWTVLIYLFRRHCIENNRSINLKSRLCCTVCIECLYKSLVFVYKLGKFILVLFSLVGNVNKICYLYFKIKSYMYTCFILLLIILFLTVLTLTFFDFSQLPCFCFKLAHLFRFLCNLY